MARPRHDRPALRPQRDRSRVRQLVRGHSKPQTPRQRIAELQQALLIDPLTRLANRRYAELRLTARLGELKRYGSTFGVLFLDVDRFKDFNDRHGHALGDRVLREVARVVSRTVRSTDTVCRWGGDEFLALIGHVDREQLDRVAEKIRSHVAQSAVPAAHSRLPVTVSVGAALACAGDTPGKLLRLADRLMYRSKGLGGDRVSFGTTRHERSAGDDASQSGRAGIVRLVLADDHAVVRRGLLAVLVQEPDLQVVGEAANGVEAIEMARRLGPDVVLMDVNMPLMDGVEATRVIRECRPAVRVIGLSALVDAATARRMADAGASVLLSKAAASRELLSAIRDARA